MSSGRTRPDLAGVPGGHAVNDICGTCGGELCSANFGSKGGAANASTWGGHRVGCAARAVALAGSPATIVFVIDGLTPDRLFTPSWENE